jgi:predicted transcriptional regulator
MPNSTTLTVRLPESVKRRLGKVAQSTNRTKSFLAGEAISDYVNRELEIIEGISRGDRAMRGGLAQVPSGRPGRVMQPDGNDAVVILHVIRRLRNCGEDEWPQ